MEKINHKKVIISTILRILLMLTVFFTINNWANIKQIFSGEAPSLDSWIKHSFTPSNLVVSVLLSVVFYMNSLKTEKERVDWENSES